MLSEDNHLVLGHAWYAEAKHGRGPRGAACLHAALAPATICAQVPLERTDTSLKPLWAHTATVTNSQVNRSQEIYSATSLRVTGAFTTLPDGHLPHTVISRSLQPLFPPRMPALDRHRCEAVKSCI